MPTIDELLNISSSIPTNPAPGTEFDGVGVRPVSGVDTSGLSVPPSQGYYPVPPPQGYYPVPHKNAQVSRTGSTGGEGGSGNGKGQPTDLVTTDIVGSAFDPTALREDIRAKIDAAGQLFKTIFPLLDKTITDRRKAIEQDFQRTSERATEQAAQEARNLSGAFAARGLTDSDYKTDALGDLQRGFADVIGTERRAADQSLSELGKFASTTAAGLEADRSSVNDLRGYISSLETESELNDVLTDVRDRIRELQVQKAGLGTEGSFRNTLDDVAPLRNASNHVARSLSVLAKSVAPAEFKQAAARRILAESGLGDQDRDELFQTFLTQLGQAEA